MTCLRSYILQDELAYPCMQFCDSDKKENEILCSKAAEKLGWVGPLHTCVYYLHGLCIEAERQPLHGRLSLGVWSEGDCR